MLTDNNLRFWLLLALLLPALSLSASAAENPQVIKTTPQLQTHYGGGWQSWPPTRYHRDWPTVEPRVAALRNGSRFDWLAASYEVRIDDGWLELWQGFGGQASLILRTWADSDPGVSLMMHPWRGPHLVFFEQGHILKTVYPVNYYTFQEAWLAQNVDPDSWSALAVARSGPVLCFMRGRQRVLAWYNGRGYSMQIHDQHVSNKDGAALAVNNAGEAVLISTELGRLTVQWISETFGWRSEQIRGYRSGNAWEIIEDPREGLLLRYEGRRGMEQQSLDAQVIGAWW